MKMFEVVWGAFQILIGYNLVLPVLLYLLHVLKGRHRINGGQHKSSNDYAIIVTAYQETHLLPAVVSSLLNLNYANYLIYVVADNCDISNLKFDDPRVSILKPPLTLASNTLSHKYAIDNFKRHHRSVTIIDSDNIVHPEYLNELNIYFDSGYLAVQGLREAKNLDTTISKLDAIRDIYYHYYDGKILFEIGSSTTLSGSGMAFSTKLYKEFLLANDVNGAGFDKVLQNFILTKDLKIAFAEKAIVYDEKTSKSDQLVNQRSRWINTWFKYFSYGFGLIVKGISRGSLNQFIFGLVLLRPPLFIFLLLSLACFIINLWLNPGMAILWSFAFLLFIVSFFVALIRSNADRRHYLSLLGIPRFIFLQIISLLKSKNANSKSVATSHYIEEIKDQPKNSYESKSQK